MCCGEHAILLLSSVDNRKKNFSCRYSLGRRGNDDIIFYVPFYGTSLREPRVTILFTHTDQTNGGKVTSHYIRR